MKRDYYSSYIELEDRFLRYGTPPPKVNGKQFTCIVKHGEKPNNAYRDRVFIGTWDDDHARIELGAKGYLNEDRKQFGDSRYREHLDRLNFRLSRRLGIHVYGRDEYFLINNMTFQFVKSGNIESGLQDFLVNIFKKWVDEFWKLICSYYLPEKDNPNVLDLTKDTYDICVIHMTLMLEDFIFLAAKNVYKCFPAAVQLLYSRLTMMFHIPGYHYFRGLDYRLNSGYRND